MAGRASGIAMMSPPHAWKPTPRPDPAVQRGPRPMSCGRRDRLSTLPNGPDSNSKRNANDCRTTPREGLKQTPPRTPATGHGNAHVCVEPSKGSAISRTRGGEFPYRFERKKRQSFRRGHRLSRRYDDFRAGVDYIQTDQFVKDFATGVDVATDGALLSRTFGEILDNEDQFFAGWSNKLTMGGTNWAREQMWGDSATRNHSGLWNDTGDIFGGYHLLAMAFAEPGAAWANTAVDSYFAFVD